MKKSGLIGKRRTKEKFKSWFYFFLDLIAENIKVVQEILLPLSSDMSHCIVFITLCIGVNEGENNSERSLRKAIRNEIEQRL